MPIAGRYALCGIRELLLAAIRDCGIRGLTITSNNADLDDFGIGILLQTRQVKRMISLNVGESAQCMRPYLVGALEVQEG